MIGILYLIELMWHVGDTQGMAAPIVRQHSPVCRLEGVLQSRTVMLGLYIAPCAEAVSLHASRLQPWTASRALCTAQRASFIRSGVLNNALDAAMLGEDCCGLKDLCRESLRSDIHPCIASAYSMALGFSLFYPPMYTCTVCIKVQLLL